MNDQQTEKDGYWLTASCLLFATIILLREWTVWRLSGGLYGTYSVPPLLFSEVQSWLPLAFKVSQGNLFPVSPSIDAAQWGLRFYPYLSLWLHGALIAVFGVPAAYFIGHTLFPIGSYCLLFLLFRRFLTVGWSITLCFITLISFVSFPFRDFLLEIVKGTGWREVVTYEPLAATGFPAPAFSLFSFFGVFYLSSEKKRLTFPRTTLLTVLWALQSQVHIVNAVIGLSFWFLSVPTRWRRQNPGVGHGELAKFWLVQAAIAVAVLSPALWAFYRINGQQGVDLMALSGTPPADELLFGPFYYIAYFVAPTALILIVYLVERVDPYEFLFRFRSIYALMGIELTLNLLYSRFGLPLPPSLIFSRLGLFFLHIYYFVPVVYFLQRPPVEFHAGVESLPPLRYVRLSLRWLFTKASQVYLPVVVGLFCLYGVASALAQTRHFKGVEVPALRAAWDELAALTENAPEKGTLVSDNPAVNLLIPIATGNATLWVNRFCNQASRSDVVERLALFARIFGWSEENFITFMSPGPFQQLIYRTPLELGCGSSRRDVAKKEDCYAPWGIGYWLAMHHAHLGASDLETYQTAVRKVFRGLDVRSTAQRFAIRRVLSRRPISARLPVAAKRLTPQGTLYELEYK